jgi:hypothetical protein
LFGFDQEAGAVNLPVTGRAAHCVDPRGRGASCELRALSCELELLVPTFEI